MQLNLVRCTGGGPINVSVIHISSVQYTRTIRDKGKLPRQHYGEGIGIGYCTWRENQQCRFIATFRHVEAIFQNQNHSGGLISYQTETALGNGTGYLRR